MPELSRASTHIAKKLAAKLAAAASKGKFEFVGTSYGVSHCIN